MPGAGAEKLENGRFWQPCLEEEEKEVETETKMEENRKRKREGNNIKMVIKGLKVMPGWEERAEAVKKDARWSRMVEHEEGGKVVAE